MAVERSRVALLGLLVWPFGCALAKDRTAAEPQHEAAVATATQTEESTGDVRAQPPQKTSSDAVGGVGAKPPQKKFSSSPTPQVTAPVLLAQQPAQPAPPAAQPAAQPDPTAEAARKAAEAARQAQAAARAALQQVTTPAAPVTPPVPQTGNTQATLGFRVDCLHNFNVPRGSTQDCLSLSGARVAIAHQLSPEVHGTVTFDPFATPDVANENSPLRTDLPTSADTQLGIISDYAMVWDARPNLQVAIQSYDGAAIIPSVSGLSLANTLASLGWRQTALTLGYSLSVPVPMHVTFAAGNGEGEPVHKLNPQGYFGFTADAEVVKSLHLVLGGSLNGNDVGSESYQWEQKQFAGTKVCRTPLTMPQSQRGHSTQRLAAGLRLDGTLAAAPGLEVGLGWQRVVQTDLDKGSQSQPTADELDANGCTVNLDTVFVEDPSGGAANSVKRTTLEVSAKYPLLDRYFVAADYSTRNLDLGSGALFRSCANFSGNTCTAPTGERSAHLAQDAFTVGGGMTLAAGLVLTFEYYRETLDHTYAEAFFSSDTGTPASSLEVFNARVAYNWQ